MASRNAYKLRRQVEQAILTHGGIIFGGHVRDVVLHDLHAAEFYKAVGGRGKDELYNDATCHPEWSGRLAISNDIDCYMVAHAIEPFLESLADEHISVHKVFERCDAKKYLPSLNIPSGVVSHIRYKATNIGMSNVRYVHQLVREGINSNARVLVTRQIDMFVTSLREASDEVEPLMLDVFVADCANFYNMCPPFGRVDFECNGLIMMRGGIMLAPTLYSHLPVMTRQNTLQRIIEDISARKAVHMDDDLHLWRVTKMQKKGWIIEMKHVVKCDVPAADVCIFCHEDVPAKHYKLRCCSAIYHKACLVKVLSSEYGSSCIQCKQDTDAHHDIPILECEA